MTLWWWEFALISYFWMFYKHCLLLVQILMLTVTSLVQAVVHCGPLSAAIWWSHLPADPFFSCGWCYNLEWTSNRFKASRKRCLFSIPPPSQDWSFPLGLGRDILGVGNLKGRYIHFDWLIDMKNKQIHTWRWRCCISCKNNNIMVYESTALKEWWHYSLNHQALLTH